MERLIQGARSPLHRIWLLILYATGMRREELVHLKVSDIDSGRMLIRIRQGKGRKDRDVMLSPRLLEELRDYWRRVRPKPKTYLFPSKVPRQKRNAPMQAKSVFHAVQQAARRAGLEKHVHPHTVAIEHLFPPYTEEKVKALSQWFEYQGTRSATKRPQRSIEMNGNARGDVSTAQQFFTAYDAHDVDGMLGLSADGALGRYAAYGCESVVPIRGGSVFVGARFRMRLRTFESK